MLGGGPKPSHFFTVFRSSLGADVVNHPAAHRAVVEVHAHAVADVHALLVRSSSEVVEGSIDRGDLGDDAYRARGH